MTKGKDETSLDWETLRLGNERCDADLLIDLYAEDARLSIVNADAPHASSFELCGKAEIAEHLRATFDQETSHRVERGVVAEDRVTFQEDCEYQDGSRMRVETTLGVHEGKIVRQVDVVARDAPADHEEVIGQRPPTRNIQMETHSGVDAPPSGDLSGSRQATEKEDLR